MTEKRECNDRKKEGAIFVFYQNYYILIGKLKLQEVYIA